MYLWTCINHTCIINVNRNSCWKLQQAICKHQADYLLHSVTLCLSQWFVTQRMSCRLWCQMYVLRPGLKFTKQFRRNFPIHLYWKNPPRLLSDMHLLSVSNIPWTQTHMCLDHHPQSEGSITPTPEPRAPLTHAYSVASTGATNEYMHQERMLRLQRLLGDSMDAGGMDIYKEPGNNRRYILVYLCTDCISSSGSVDAFWVPLTRVSGIVVRISWGILSIRWCEWKKKKE